MCPPLASKHRNGNGTASGPPGADSRAVSRCASCTSDDGATRSARRQLRKRAAAAAAAAAAAGKGGARTMWCTAPRGFPLTAASVFAAFRPTARQGGRPGPRVTATTSMSRIVHRASDSARTTTPGSRAEWRCVATLGTMPPIGSWCAACPAMTLDRISLRRRRRSEQGHTRGKPRAPRTGRWSLRQRRCRRSWSRWPAPRGGAATAPAGRSGAGLPWPLASPAARACQVCVLLLDGRLPATRPAAS